MKVSGAWPTGLGKGFKSNTQNQSGLCVLNLDLVLEAMGSYENILFGENEMISFMENGLGGSKTRGRKKQLKR